MKELSLENCRLDKRYDIFAQLGRGSYAEIFAAKDTLASEQSPHRLVAIKALNVFLQDDLDPDLDVEHVGAGLPVQLPPDRPTVSAV